MPRLQLTRVTSSIAGRWHQTVRSRPEWARLPILIVTAKDITPEERKRLNGRIQALVAKGRLTPDRLQAQLRRVGLRVGA